jgi:hypothetical protein
MFLMAGLVNRPRVLFTLTSFLFLKGEEEDASHV